MLRSCSTSSRRSCKMSIRPTLLAEIRTALGDAISPSLTTHSNVSDVYEGYILSVLLRAARAEEANVVLSSIRGDTPERFVFRTSPGYLNSRRHNYGYVELHFAHSPPLEVHMGVRVAGQSNVLHECDVSVIDKSEAERCRRRSPTVAPRAARVRMLVEAKYYTTALGLQLGREFLGLVRDLSRKNSFFVFNCAAESVEKLLAHKNEKWEHKVLPSNVMAVDRLDGAFQVALRDYKASTRT